MSTAQQQLAAAQSAQAADAATAEQRLRLLQQQLAAAEAGLMRRMTGKAGVLCALACCLLTIVFIWQHNHAASDLSCIHLL